MSLDEPIPHVDHAPGPLCGGCRLPLIPSELAIGLCDACTCRAIGCNAPSGKYGWCPEHDRYWAEPDSEED